MKLLPNKRLVRFADVGSYSPDCICIRDDIIVIYIWSVTVKYNEYNSRNHIIWMNTDGIVTKRSLFSEIGWKRPCSIHSLESGLCVLYRVNANHNLHAIELLEAKSDKCNKLYAFNGIYGLNPQKNFECGGMCVDKAGNILVSDYRHHSVYILDKELRYKNKLFDSKNGLDKQTVISLLNEHIWVADGNQIFIFKYTNDAWVIVDGKLRKIVDHYLEDDVYADTVVGIVVLKDSCVLVLNFNESYIMKLLTTRRLVRFADVLYIDRHIYYYPYGFSITQDDLLVIYLWSESGKRKQGYHSIVWLNTDGIMICQTSFNEKVWQKPCSIYSLESDLCILYRVNSISKRHRIDILEATSSKCKSQYDFKGIYGLSPETNFECKGMCVDNAGHLFISDFRHHSVYVLYKELKYKKTLFDERNGLDEPASIALFNNHLWVSDQNQIFIFQYS
ncbi:unnamed protein product [Mytilus coruscus]|uniref:Uncharacterized protein n=1 Tax=Mytilus coruscus TaxID=42192 RepID=A0A6J8A469_MYTCO|nr:unnamed protein product [Mytilus coruscus]